jgi:hypothetical protein
MDQFVFVSHAVKDKPLLGELVKALIGAGIKVWIDQPSKLGFSTSEVDRYFYRIRAGGRWEREIDDAKRKASCILVCWSKHAQGAEALMHHPVWFEEAAFGRTEGKLVSCKIDSVDVSLIPRGFAAQQIPDARNTTELSLLIGDVKRVMADFAKTMASGRHTAGKLRSSLLPYLVNRTQQEGCIEDGLEEIAHAGGVRPFFLAGPENECVDEFLKRLEEHSSRRCLGGSAGWEAIAVPWPSEEPADCFGENFARRVAGVYGRRGRIAAPELASVLSSRERVVAIVSRLTSQDWKQDEEGRLQSWLQLWRNVAEQPGFRRVVPILAVKMPHAAPGWKEVPGSGLFSQERRRNKQIWRAVGKLTVGGVTLPFVRLGILAPVPRRDADDWCGQYLPLAGEKALGKLYSIRAHRDYGAPHANFVEVVQPLLSAAG